MTLNSIAHSLPLLLGKEMGGGGHEGMTGIKAIVKDKIGNGKGVRHGVVWYGIVWHGVV